MFGQAWATGEPTTIEMMHSIDDQQWYRLARYSHILETDYGYCFDKNIQENGKKVSSQETLHIHASCNEKPFISTVA